MELDVELQGRASPGCKQGRGPAGASARVGLLLGVMAVGFWSFGASFVYLGAKEAGTWTFVALGSLTGGGLQLIGRWLWRRELRTALRLPWRLWLVPVACFVVYGLAWPCALATASPRQVFGVNLINYLWPALTVLLSAWWVPGARLTVRVLVALLLALAGLVVANLVPLRELLANGASGGPPELRQFLPFALALLAAVTWAVYSAVLARWRAWSKDYVTSPVGFLVIGAVAGVVLWATGAAPAKLTWRGAAFTFLYGVGPLAVGYLLWELALAKARVHTLSFIAAITPILSTALLCCFLRTWPGLELCVAAALVSGGVVLSGRE